jgi:hypothetical protein
MEDGQIPRSDPTRSGWPPAEGAVRSRLPVSQEPQLASAANAFPHVGEWVSEQTRRVSPPCAYRPWDWASGNPKWTGLDRADALFGKALPVPEGRERLAGWGARSTAAGRHAKLPRLQGPLILGQDRSLHFYAFDILDLDGWDLRQCPLIEWKRLLEDVHTLGRVLRYTGHLKGDPATLLAEARRLKLEGIIVKQADPVYSVAVASWRNFKCIGREDLLVIGWTPPTGARFGIGCLVLGYYDKTGALHHAGAVGSGFSADELKSWALLCEALAE